MKSENQENVGIKFDPKLMCHYHTCQRQAVDGDPNHLCGQCRANVTRLSEFLTTVQTASIGAGSVARKITNEEVLKTSKTCFLCPNCRSLYFKTKICCPSVGLLHIDTSSIVIDKKGGIVECRSVEYNAKSF